jgi:hypothetical protein
MTPELNINDSPQQRLDRLRHCICLSFGSHADDFSNSTFTTSPQLDNSTSWNSQTEAFPCDSTTADIVQSANIHFRYLEELLKNRIAIVICVLGLVGNLANLLVLVPQGHSAMGRMERFAYWGLVSLAVSDAMFCLTVVPHAFVERDPIVFAIDFSLLYSVYGDALVNVFIMASTWITVTLAVGRYLAICHPFRAREIIGTTIAKRAVFLVYGACIALNVPRFLVYRVEHIRCGDVVELYFRWPGPTHVKTSPVVERVHMWLYFVVGILVPFVCLVVSNVFLVRALRVARSKLTLIRAVETRTADPYRPVTLTLAVTLTLVVLVIMYVVLVSPAEFAMFLRQRLARDGQQVRGYHGVMFIHVCVCVCVRACVRVCLCPNREL